MSELKGKLSRKQEVAIAALLTKPTIGEAAKVAAVSERTLWRWMQQEEFITSYREARRQAVSQAVAQLQQVCCEAVQTLQTVMKDRNSPASSRVSAAKAVLEMALKAVELEDLSTRIEKLEQLTDKHS